MDHYGIRGSALAWFESYLTNRQHYVTFNGVKSSWKTIKCGVLHGSILGPLLFLLYINDLAKICKHTMPMLFADDTNLFAAGKILQYYKIYLMKSWRKSRYGLKSINCPFMSKRPIIWSYHPQKRLVPDISIYIEGHLIDKVSCSKFLGVFIDEKLNWKRDINYVSGKISRGIGDILKARKLSNRDSLITLYHSFIYPYYTYCNHV